MINKKNDIFWSFNKFNYLLFTIGICDIMIGYIIMYLGETDSFQSTKLAPIILFLGYCFIIPISIIYKPKTL